jgi:hypothetical protein
MPTMNTITTLRVEPNGAREPTVANDGDQVEALGTQVVNGPTAKETWTKVQLLEVDALPSGWVPTENIDFGTSTPDQQIEMPDVARQCWWVYLMSGVNPYYLVAIAQLRSDLFGDQDSTGIGPFRFTQAEWDAGRINPKFGLGTYREKDISDWRMQCIMYGAMTLDARDSLEVALGRPPSWIELYLSQLIGAKAASTSIASPNATLDAAFVGLLPQDLPPGGLTGDQILDRYSTLLRDKGPPPRVLKGSEAINEILSNLQDALEAVQATIADVGNEFVGANSNGAPPDTPDVPDPKASIPTPRKATSPIPKQITTGGPPLIAGAGGVLGELIAAHESGRAGYGAFNRGIAGDSTGKSIDFSKLTIQNIMAMQQLPRGDPRKLFAVGKYQLIPGTMAQAVATLKLKPSAFLTPSLQETLFRNFLVSGKRPEVKAFILNGDNSKLRDAQIALANEFASVGLPDTGVSKFAGLAGNKASITPAVTVHALVQEHVTYLRNLQSGMSPADAWSALSPGIKP